MPVIRTPDERFSKLPDFLFAPHYIEVNGLRIHYVDEGKGETILCLHGEPSWSFLSVSYTHLTLPTILLV